MSAGVPSVQAFQSSSCWALSSASASRESARTSAVSCSSSGTGFWKIERGQAVVVSTTAQASRAVFGVITGRCMVGAPQMIKRILIENYRCFEKAVIEPDSLALLVGPNGAGKSTVFEVLFKIRQLVTGNGSVSELFPDNTRTRWGREAT